MEFFIIVKDCKVELFFRMIVEICVFSIYKMKKIWSFFSFYKVCSKVVFNSLGRLFYYYGFICFLDLDIFWYFCR